MLRCVSRKFFFHFYFMPRLFFSPWLHTLSLLLTKPHAIVTICRTTTFRSVPVKFLHTHKKKLEIKGKKSKAFVFVKVLL